MECSHEGIGVHTCVENSNENAAIECIGERIWHYAITLLH